MDASYLPGHWPPCSNVHTNDPAQSQNNLGRGKLLFNCASKEATSEVTGAVKDTTDATLTEVQLGLGLQALLPPVLASSFQCPSQNLPR